MPQHARSWDDARVAEDAAVAQVQQQQQQQLPAVDHRGFERAGEGRVPAGDPPVSVSETLLL